MSNVRQIVSAAAVGGAVAATLALVTAGNPRSAGPAPAQAAQAPPASGVPLSRYLRFTGTGTASVRPDTATIWFSTSGESSVKGSAVNAASAHMRQVIAAMGRNGIAQRDMQTSSDVYQDTSRGVYEASESLQVTVHKVESAGKLVAVGLNAGASSSSGPEFSLDNQNAGYDAALRAAVANARAHADAAAALIGVRLTDVISVDDVPVASGEPIYGALTRAVPDSAVPVPTKRGMQQVSVTVTVTYGYAA